MSEAMNTIALSYQQNSAITAGNMKSIQMHDLYTMDSIAQRDITEDVYVLILNKDENTIFYGGTKKVISSFLIGEFNSSKIIEFPKYHSGIILSLVLSRDEKLLFSGCNKGILICWNLKDYSKIWLIQSDWIYKELCLDTQSLFILSQKKNQSQISKIRISTDINLNNVQILVSSYKLLLSMEKDPKQRIIYFCGIEGLIGIHNQNSKSTYYLPKKHKKNVYQVRKLAKEYQILTSGDDNSIYLWNIQTKSVLQEFITNNSHILCLKIHESDDYFVYGDSLGDFSIEKFNKSNILNNYKNLQKVFLNYQQTESILENENLDQMWSHFKDMRENDKIRALYTGVQIFKKLQNSPDVFKQFQVACNLAEDIETVLVEFLSSYCEQKSIKMDFEEDTQVLPQIQDQSLKIKKNILQWNQCLPEMIQQQQQKPKLAKKSVAKPLLETNKLHEQIQEDDNKKFNQEIIVSKILETEKYLQELKGKLDFQVQEEYIENIEHKRFKIEQYEFPQKKPKIEQFLNLYQIKAKNL